MPTASPAGKTPAKDKSSDKAADKTTDKTADKSSSKPAEKAPEKSILNPFVSMSFEAFLAKLTPKDRLNVERHVAAVEEQSTKVHAKIWKRIAATMMTLASHSAKANGQQSMQFYIQDGKYRMQIFALEDLRDGKIHVYATDAIDEAVKSGSMGKPKAGEEPTAFHLPHGKDTLTVERLDGKVSNPAPFYKDMLGWNRRAAHVILPVMATDAQVDATEKLLLAGAKKAGVK